MQQIEIFPSLTDKEPERLSASLTLFRKADRRFHILAAQPLMLPKISQADLKSRRRLLVLSLPQQQSLQNNRISILWTDGTRALRVHDLAKKNKKTPGTRRLFVYSKKRCIQATQNGIPGQKS